MIANSLEVAQGKMFPRVVEIVNKTCLELAGTPAGRTNLLSDLCFRLVRYDGTAEPVKTLR